MLMKRFVYTCLLATVLLQLRAETVTFTVNPGFNAWTVPCCLTNGSTLYQLIPDARIDETVWFWSTSNNGWRVLGIDGGVWIDFTTGEPYWATPLAPGTGFFYHTWRSTPRTITLGLSLTNTTPPALPTMFSNTYYFRGASSGLPATYEQVFGVPPRDETALFRFIPGSTNVELSASNYLIYYFKDGTWSPETPVLAPYEPALSIFPYLSVKPTQIPGNGSLLLQWPSRGRLEEADSPNGPWRDLGTVTNQFSIQPSTNAGGRRFYRAKEARITE